MNVIIYGFKNCNETKKAERFFKERNIKFHFRDLSIKSLTENELDNILKQIKPDDLINKNSKSYKEKQLQYKVYDIKDEILEDPKLIKTPIIRINDLILNGFEDNVLKDIIKKINNQ